MLGLAISVVPYFWELFWRALSDTWHFFPGKGFGPFAVPLVIVMLSLLRKYRRKPEEGRLHIGDWLKSARDGVIAFLVIFLIHFVYVTPKAMVGECRTASPSRQPTTDEWPALTPTQIAQWVERLEPHHIHKIQLDYGQEVNAKKFRKSLEKVGKYLKFEVTFEAGHTEQPYVTIYAPQRAGSELQDLFQTDLHPARLETKGFGVEESGEVIIFLPDRSQD